jgi:hypothetical protein
MSMDKPEELDVKSKASLFGERATFKKTADPIERSGATSPRFREVTKQNANDNQKPSSNTSTSNLTSKKEPSTASASSTAKPTTTPLQRTPSYPSSSQAMPESNAAPEPKRPDPTKTEVSEW